MLSSARSSLIRFASTLTARNSRLMATQISSVRLYSAKKQETDEDFDNKWEAYFRK
jgi:hypothetical protein